MIKPGELQTDRVLTVQQADAGEGNKTGGGPGKGSGSRDKKLGLEGRPFTKLEQLFFLSRDEFDGFQYAHAWSSVYFLNNFENGKYQKAFDKFFKGLYTLEKGIPFEPAGRGKKVKPEDIRAYLLKKLGVKDAEDLGGRVAQLHRRDRDLRSRGAPQARHLPDVRRGRLRERAHRPERRDRGRRRKRARSPRADSASRSRTNPRRPSRTSRRPWSSTHSTGDTTTCSRAR